MAVFENVTKEDIPKLVKRGFLKEQAKTIYETARFTKEGVTAVLYSSGKLLLQGKDTGKAVQEIKRAGIGRELEHQRFKKETGWIIGSDEALKGDTFGGLVVAAVKADDGIRARLMEIGVADSKKLSDKEILQMAGGIRKIAPCEVKSILPEDYNKHDGNLTALLDKLHHQCADFLKPGKHVIDEYPGCGVGDVITPKAESKYVEVAAASILARDAALKQLDFLSMEAGFTVPKGSTHVKEALQEMKIKGLSPVRFIKIRFANVKEFV